MSVLRRFLRDESGATAIEYSMIASGTSIVIVAAANALGITLTEKYTLVAQALAGE
jgi:pilus assembly protein Flp/PilA